jgi:hypothetical protein
LKAVPIFIDCFATLNFIFHLIRDETLNKWLKPSSERRRGVIRLWHPLNRVSS